MSYMIFNPQYRGLKGVAKIAIFIWLIFSTLYVAVDNIYPIVINKINNDVFSNGQSVGYQKAISDLGIIMEKQFQEGCKAGVPVTYGTGKTVSLYSLECLKMAGVVMKDNSGDTAGVTVQK